MYVYIYIYIYACGCMQLNMHFRFRRVPCFVVVYLDQQKCKHFNLITCVLDRCIRKQSRCILKSTGWTFPPSKLPLRIPAPNAKCQKSSFFRPSTSFIVVICTTPFYHLLHFQHQFRFCGAIYYRNNGRISF